MEKSLNSILANSLRAYDDWNDSLGQGNYPRSRPSSSCSDGWHGAYGYSDASFSRTYSGNDTGSGSFRVLNMGGSISTNEVFSSILNN